MSFNSLLLLISIFIFCRSLDKGTKITIVGAGNVGSTLANYLALSEVSSEILLFNIRKGKAEGKAIDIMQSAEVLGFNSIVTGVTNDYTRTANSDVVVIASGISGKPGMTREELLEITSNIIKASVEKLILYSPNAIFVVVSNPVDAMTKLTLKLTGLPRNRVIGMGSLLDSCRFKYYLAQALEVNQKDIQGLVIGGHGDKTMIPLIRYAKYKGIPVSNLLPKSKIEEVIKATMIGGTSLIKLLGTSAWMASGASIAYIVDSIINDKKRLITCSTYLKGEYGWKDITIGIPVIVGKNGIEKIVNIELNEEEKALFDIAAKNLKQSEDMLDQLALFNK